MRVTYAVAAGSVGVTVDTVRKWVEQGHLTYNDGIDLTEIELWAQTINTQAWQRAAGIRELDERMTAPGYQPAVQPPAVVAAALGVTRQAVNNWQDRSDRTGVHRHPGGVDVNEALRWVLTRKQRAFPVARLIGSE